MIVPIFKGGDAKETTNYRGISVLSCLGKLFASIINSRISHFITENNLIHKSQIGFKEKHRTAYHIFVLKTLIQDYKEQRKHMFCCFLNFKKLSDSIWHAGLVYKLYEWVLGQDLLT